MHSFRFVHAADIHLDSPLKGLTGQQGSSVDLIRSATRAALDALVGRTIKDQAQFLIIAGDLYDGDWRDYQTGQFFAQQMGRLREAGINVYLIHGNHDAQSQLTRQLTLPDNVTVFPASRPETVEIPNLRVALHGQSFADPKVTENLAIAYPDPTPGVLNVGLLHTAMSGSTGHDSYAPCSLDQLVQKGYDYWALGHVHKPEIVRNGHPYIVYSGVLQGRHIRETGPKGAIRVSVEDGGIVGVDPFQVDVVRWDVVEVSADDCGSFEDLVDAIRSALDEAVRQRADDRLLACRIRLSGTTPAHAVALTSEDRLLAEARAAAAGIGSDCAWIERLEIATRPERRQEGRASIEEAFGDIDEAKADEALFERLSEDLGLFVSKLPHEIRNESDDLLLQAAVSGDYHRLIELAGPYTMARLTEHEA